MCASRAKSCQSMERTASAAAPREFPLTLSPLILFALESSEQRPGEMPATALPPARPRTAPDGTAALGTDLRRGEQESGAGAGVRLPQHQAGHCRARDASRLFSKWSMTLCLEKVLVLLGPLLGSSQLGSSFCVPDHRIRPRKFPGQEDGVHLGLSKHHGVWFRQHPLPKGGVWRVSTRLPVAWMLSQVGGWRGKGCLSTCRAGESHPTELEPSTAARGSQVRGSHPARVEQRALGSTSMDTRHTGPGDSSNTFGLI